MEGRSLDSFEHFLKQIDGLVNDNLELNNILREVARVAAEAVNANAGLIHSQPYEETGSERSRLRSIHKNRAEILPGSALVEIFACDTADLEILETFRDPRSAVWQMLQSGGEMYIPCLQNPHTGTDAKTLPAKLHNLLKDTGVSSMISVPICIGDERAGSLALFRCKEEENFTERDFSLVRLVGQAAGKALENAHLQRELQRIERHDTLTGVFNRRYFFELVQDEILRSQRYQSPLSVVLLDVDQFRRVNETYGREAGDRVLKDLAARFRKVLRAVDRTARYGGDEYVFLLPETPPEGGRIAAERICRQLESESTPVPEGVVFLTASLGVTGVNAVLGELSVETLLNRADEALTHAKQHGCNRVCMWGEHWLSKSE